MINRIWPGVLAGILSASAQPAVTCQPEPGSIPADVAALCGPADSEHIASGELGTQSEWLYGDSVVGFLDGRVAYVLN